MELHMEDYRCLQVALHIVADCECSPKLSIQEQPLLPVLDV